MVLFVEGGLETGGRPLGPERALRGHAVAP